MLHSTQNSVYLVLFVGGRNKLRLGGPRQQNPYSDPLRRESFIQKLPQNGTLPSETYLIFPEAVVSAVHGAQRAAVVCHHTQKSKHQTARLMPENCAFLGYNAASIGSSLQTFRDNLSVQPSRI